MGSKATNYVIAIVLLCIGMLLFVLTLTLRRPTVDNTSVIATGLGLVVPVVMSLLAATVQEVHLAVNSRLTQLLELTAKSSRAEGELDRRSK